VGADKKTNSIYRWLTPVFLATWEAEIGRITVQGPPRQISLETPSPKEPGENGLEVWLKW
jgi:hypothetical protein